MESHFITYNISNCNFHQGDQNKSLQNTQNPSFPWTNALHNTSSKCKQFAPCATENNAHKRSFGKKAKQQWKHVFAKKATYSIFEFLTTEEEHDTLKFFTNETQNSKNIFQYIKQMYKKRSE